MCPLDALANAAHAAPDPLGDLLVAQPGSYQDQHDPMLIGQRRQQFAALGCRLLGDHDLQRIESSWLRVVEIQRREPCLLTAHHVSTLLAGEAAMKPPCLVLDTLGGVGGDVIGILRTGERL